MNGAAFKTLRQTMGLRLEWVAVHFDVQPRSIQRWEKSPDDIPEPFAEKMEALIEVFNDFLKQEMGSVKVVYSRYAEKDFKKEGPFYLTERNLPESFYGAALGVLCFMKKNIFITVSSKELEKPTR